MPNFELFDNLSDYQSALGAAPIFTEDFENFEVGENLAFVEFLPEVFVSSNLPNLEVFQGSDDDKNLFGFGGDVRQQGEAGYAIDFVLPYNAVAFDIEAFNPETPGPAVLEIVFADDNDTDLGSSTFIDIFPTNETESEPIFFGVIADTPIQSIILNEGPEIGGSGNEEIALDNFSVAEADFVFEPPSDEFVINVSEIPGFELLDEPLQIDEGIWFLGTGPSPDEVRVLLPANVNSADTIDTDRLQPGGDLGLNLTGSGLTVGVWEPDYVRDTHQEFQESTESRVTFGDGEDGSRTFANHATHVAGTIGASGVNPEAKGMASQVNIVSYDYLDDIEELDDAASSIVVSNHSYGPARGWEGRQDWGDAVGPVDTWWGERDLFTEDATFGKYNSDAEDLDEVLFENPNLLSVWIAGNERSGKYNTFTNASGDNTYATGLSNPLPGTPMVGSLLDGTPYYLVSTADFAPPPKDGADTGFDTLISVAKNNLVVGAVEHNTSDPIDPTTVRITSFSSFGPTDDGRVKPDVVANGQLVLSSYAGADDDYDVIFGTSMAAPSVTGTAVLLIEHYQNLFSSQPRSATTKGLLIHTAIDAGNIGPDYSFGWGLVNAANAADFLSNTATPLSSFLLEEKTYNGTEQTITVQSDGNNPLKATIVWTDPAGTPQGAGLDVPTSVLVNDLDLWITGPDGTHLPWTLDPANPASPAVRTTTNHVDNVEQVLIDTPVAGEYTIHIGHTGSSLTQDQDFSLLVSTEQMLVSTEQVFNVIDGTGDDNFLEGTPERDLINGLDGDDILLGKEGDDRLLGGAGNDILNGGDGRDTLNGGSDTDTASYDNNPFGVGINLSVSGDNAQDGFGNLEQLINIENLIGSAHSDFLGGDDHNNRLEGKNGNDRLAGNAGDDTLEGGNGRDVLNGGDGKDTLDGGDDIDTASYENDPSSDEDRQLGVFVNLPGIAARDGWGNGDILLDIENVIGSRFGDLITGNTDANLLRGLAGADTLNGGDENDTLDGGDGTDTLNGGDGNDTLNGGDGKDTLDGGDDIDTASYENDPSSDRDRQLGVFVNLPGIAARDGWGNGDILLDIENVIGSRFGDLITGNDGPNLLDGGDGKDSLYGGEGMDVLKGGNGNDLLKGEKGSDLLEGQGGNDNLVGGGAGDILNGGDGDDRLWGEAQSDILNGGSGNDFLRGGPGPDVLTGGEGGDVFVIESQNNGVDRFTDFKIEEDAIGLRDGLGIADLSISRDIIGRTRLSGGGQILATLENAPNDLEIGDLNIIESCGWTCVDELLMLNA